jgi:peptidyl-dipeptidase Dcp
MKLTFLIFLTAGLMINLYSGTPENEGNPFLKPYNTPYGVPPFDEIKSEHYLPAIKEGIKQQQEEIAAIVNNNEAPDFANTIEALENSGALLGRVTMVMSNLMSSSTTEDLQRISKEASPLRSKNNDDITLNAELFSRVKTVYGQKDKLNLDTEQQKLLDETYKRFAKYGANLNEEQKTRLRQINEELALLSLQFSDNLLKETNSFKMLIDNEEDLAGLPEGTIKAASDAAENAGEKGKWVFTLHKPSFIPFLTYSEKRDLREKIFKGYINRGDNDNSYDNKEIIKKVINLRIEKAKMLGYETHADYVLEDAMAKTPAAVYDLLNQLWAAALPNAEKEAEELQKMIEQEGNDFKLEAWDWWYYSEKVKKAKYDLDEEELKPYFRMENVRQGVFELASKLFGLRFEELRYIPKYNPEVSVYEVKEADGTHIGLFFTDYFPRESKRGGAWMNYFRKQKENVSPIVCNVGNFTKPAGDIPSLLTMDEVRTLFHEFGHALHGLLSDAKYESLSGTSVPRDFVELPSQVMENWATEPEFLRTYAVHYLTGDTIPDVLIEKIQNTAYFNQGFVTVEYLSAALLDMKIHVLQDASDYDVNEFEQKALNEINMLPEIVVRYRTPNFQHIFSSGYDAGYYSYIWAAVLDADAFEAFKETSLFDRKTADAFREYVLSKGGTSDPMSLYRSFRGKDPAIEPLLKRRGLM